jgi:hypothetical protein
LARTSLLTGPFLSNFLICPISLIFLPLDIKLITSFIILLVSLIFIYLKFFSFVNYSVRNVVDKFNGLIWGLPIFRGGFISINALWLREYIYRNLDLGWIEWNTKKNSDFAKERIWVFNWQTRIIKNHFLILLYCFCSLKKA